MKMLVKALIFLPLLLLAGCLPDLTVTKLDVTWNNTGKIAVARIRNIGNANAGPFLVYFNAEEDPVSHNHRPQVRKNLFGLHKGASTELTADFAPLAHPDNANLANVKKIAVFVDAKNMVKELNENNNSMEKPVP
jgi:hypothetical protein